MIDKNTIPKHWEIKQLSDIGEIVSGGTPSTKVPAYWNGYISWITPADLSGYSEKRIYKGKKSITEQGLKNSSARLMPKDSVLFSSRAPIGYVVISSNELCTNQGFKSIVPGKSINVEFLYYYLKSSKNIAEDAASGTTFKEISSKKFSKLEIPLPPLSEQQQIVSKIEELFCELDQGKQQLENIKQQLKTYRQAVLKWAFEGRFTSINKSAAGTSRDLSRSNDNLNSLPEGWKWVRVSEISNVVRGGSPRPAGDPRFYNGNIPFLKVADITKDGKVYLNSYNYTIKEAGLQKTRKIKPFTLLLSNSGATLGVPKICLINATMNDGIAAFLDLDKRSILYLYYFWLSKTRELRNINMGAAQPNLNTDIIKDYSIPYCSFEKQEEVVSEIETRLSVCDKMEETIENSLRQVESLRQSILKQAFEGKLI